MRGPRDCLASWNEPGMPCRKDDRMKTINVGLLGLGTVGSGVVKVFQDHPDLLDRRVGAKLRIKKIAVRRTPPGFRWTQSF